MRCAAAHSFDQAKQGYWNLLQPQDSKSKNPGDRDEAVDARHRWTTSGVMDGLVKTLTRWAVRSQPVLDLGCGTGYFGDKLYTNHFDNYCGVDLSKKAIKLASRAFPAGTWVLANADRTLPAQPKSVGQVISLFGRRPYDLVHQVLKPRGTLLVAVPAEDDLVQLRAETQNEGRLRDRTADIIQQASDAGLALIEQQTWKETRFLQPTSITDALAMTYRAERRSQKLRAETLGAMDVTLAADILIFEKSQDSAISSDLLSE